MHILVWGRRRQGKSTLSLALALAQRQTVIVWDPNNQYQCLPLVELDELEDALESLLAFRYMPIDSWEEFSELMAVLDGDDWKWQDYTLVLDESSALQNPHKLHPNLERLVRQKPADITVIETTHRPSDTNSLVKALASDVFVFQTYLARDLDYLADNFGADVAEQVAHLPKYHVLHWWLDEGGVPRTNVWAEPKLWHVPI